MATNRVLTMVGRLRPAARRQPSRPHADEVRRLRRQLRNARRRARTLEAELTRTQQSLRDPWPDLGLPDEVSARLEAVHSEGISMMNRSDLSVLAKTVLELEHSGRPGLVLETGTARGGAAIVMAAAKSSDRPMRVYDVFGMIPPPSEHDGDDVHARYATIVGGQSRGRGGEVYYGYRSNLFEEVQESFERHGLPLAATNVELVKGLFQDTLELDEPVAFAHLDGDWYESTKVCLERIAPLLVPGGRLILDDYYFWSGCRAAVDEYFANRPGFRLERRAKLHVVRCP